jgi:hypothetical protein
MNSCPLLHAGSRHNGTDVRQLLSTMLGGAAQWLSKRCGVRAELCPIARQGVFQSIVRHPHQQTGNLAN